MSNFSAIYQHYLQGYIGDIKESTFSSSERKMKALALGVHHRTTGKPPLLRSVEVTALLKSSTAPTPEHQRPIIGDVTLVAVDPEQPITAIKCVRELTYMSLKEAKNVVDSVRHEGKPYLLLKGEPDKAKEWATQLRSYGCTVEVK